MEGRRLTLILVITISIGLAASSERYRHRQLSPQQHRFHPALGIDRRGDETSVEETEEVQDDHHQIEEEEEPKGRRPIVLAIEIDDSEEEQGKKGETTKGAEDVNISMMKEKSRSAAFQMLSKRAFLSLQTVDEPDSRKKKTMMTVEESKKDEAPTPPQAASANTCTSKPFRQRLRADGCRTKIFVNQLCHGACASYFVPKGGAHARHNRPISKTRQCASCEPSDFERVSVQLDCPGRLSNVVRDVIRVKSCSCRHNEALRVEEHDNEVHELDDVSSDYDDYYEHRHGGRFDDLDRR